MEAWGGSRGSWGRPGSHFDSQGHPDAKKQKTVVRWPPLGLLFWSPFGTLFGTWSSQITFFCVFLRLCFQARFFIDFRWPEGSKNDAF